jgi:putative flippase GtrA
MRLKVRARTETERFLKFLVVGAAAFVVDTGSLSALVLLFSVERTLAKALSFVLAVLTSFVGNYLWTYRDSRSKPVRKQLAQFACVSVGGLGINLLVFSTVHSAGSRLWGPLPALYVGQVAAVGAAMIWNFFANRFITYNDVR